MAARSKNLVLSGVIAAILLCATTYAFYKLLSRSDSLEPKCVTIGILNLSAALKDTIDGFKAGMAELGYVDGRTVRYIYEGATNSIPVLTSAAENLVQAGADLILSVTTPATRAAKRVVQGTNIPVVFAPVTDPVKAQLIGSMRVPGGQLTGVASGLATGKSLEVFVKIVPSVSHILVLHSSADGSSVQALKMLEKFCSLYQLQFTVHDISTDRRALSLQALPREVDGLYILPSALITSHADEVAEAAIVAGLPTAATSQLTAQGILLSYGVRYYSVGKQASKLAHQVLKGMNPAELPAQLAEYYLDINLNTARAIDISIDPDHLLLADTIIE